ncbi:MAG: pseudouridine-5'-phosphate glycosidase [Chloroflexota bacterium]
MNFPLNFSPDVEAALAEKRAVVALESTLITHGLPYPANVETALAMEAAVRDAGATPATIAILKGQITVGLSVDEIEALAKAKSVRKCSRRDLALAVALREDGATTVAGTMIIAHRAGIRVFATGGIGGVHRGHPFDVSADLIELGRTPVAVVCSGAKAILDLPLTLEVLETQGVPIVGIGIDRLPAFYTRSSDLPIDAHVETPEQAAQIIAAAAMLGMTHGILFTVPVPTLHELPHATADAAIVRATEEAETEGIHGKALTPYVLARVAELTKGDARDANTALLINNARIAGRIACALTQIS